MIEFGHVRAPDFHRGVLNSLCDDDDATFFQKIAVPEDVVLEAYSDLCPETATPHCLFERAQKDGAVVADVRQVDFVFIVATIRLHEVLELNFAVEWIRTISILAA